MTNELNNELKLEIADYLERLGRGEIKSDSLGVVGVCPAILYKFKVNIISSKIDFSKFEFFSGNRSYPISHPSFDCPKEAYCYTDNLWIGGYGNRRKQFCLFLAKELRSQVQSETKD